MDVSQYCNSLYSANKRLATSACSRVSRTLCYMFNMLPPSLAGYIRGQCKATYIWIVHVDNTRTLHRLLAISLHMSVALTSTKIDQNCPPNWPCRIRFRSVCDPRPEQTMSACRTHKDKDSNYSVQRENFPRRSGCSVVTELETEDHYAHR